MFPLLRRDKLEIPYVALYGLFVLLYYTPGCRKAAEVTNRGLSILQSFAFACMIFLHIVYIAISPPDKYPFLFEAVIMSFCFSQFVLVSIYMNKKQWAPSTNSTQLDTEKKSL